MFMVDAYGRRVEVIVLDRGGHGPQQWIRVSQRGVLLGPGYFRDPDEALTYVDAESLIEVAELPVSAARCRPSRAALANRLARSARPTR